MVVATTATSASADWNHFWHGLHVGFHRNNAWPDPFNEVDAGNVIQPFEVMKANGWRMHNTIGHELFRSGDGALLAAGHKRVHWIASQAPTARRTVYVLTRKLGGRDSETRGLGASDTRSFVLPRSRPECAGHKYRTSDFLGSLGDKDQPRMAGAFGRTATAERQC